MRKRDALRKTGVKILMNGGVSKVKSKSKVKIYIAPVKPAHNGDVVFSGA